MAEANAHPGADRGASPRRIALISIGTAVFLIGIKLVAGLASGSLAFISEAIHSGTDLVAAIMAFVALSVAARPADHDHPYGHGKAEHLSALAEGLALVAVAIWIAVMAIQRIVEGGHEVDAAWWIIGVALLVLVVDFVRTVTLVRAARDHRSAALKGTALHFASDMAGTAAVLVGLLLVRAGVTNADSVAALFVVVVVMVAAAHLMRENVNALMDSVPDDAESAARQAVEALGPTIELRRLRMRISGSTSFVDVVVGVPPGEAVGRAHAAADAVEDAIERAVPGADVVVHVEPRDDDDQDPADRVLASAHAVSGVREVHNVRILHVGDRVEATLHLKLPADTPLGEANAVAREVDAAVTRDIPGIARVRTHVEPLEVEGSGQDVIGAADSAGAVRAIAHAISGRPPHAVRLVATADGVVAFVTLALGDAVTLGHAHHIGGAVRRRIRDEVPDIVDAFVEMRP